MDNFHINFVKNQKNKKKFLVIATDITATKYAAQMRGIFC